MHRAPTRWFLFALCAAGLAAEERTAPARDTAAQTEDAITAAKRDFQLLKSAQDGAAQPKGTVPRIAVPELHHDPAAARLRPTPIKPELDQKSANWLVEAMEQTRESRKDRNARNDRERRDGAELSGDASRREDPLGSERTGSARDERPDPQERAEDKDMTPAEVAVFNPLAQYLGDWMTPQDYALLGTRLQSGPAGGEFLRAATPAGVGGIDLGGSGAAETGLGVLASGTPGFTRPPQENPYLQALSAPAPSVGSVGSTPASGQISAPNPVPIYTPPPPPAPARTTVPDFVRPLPDEKYFKPLRRF